LPNHSVKIQIGIAASFVILAALFLVSMEWLFFITKPSFFDSFSLFQSIQAYLLVALATATSGVFIVTTLALPLFLVRYLTDKDCFRILLIVPALLLMFSSLLLVDNFSNSLFTYGISRTEGVFRLISFVFFCFVFYRIVRNTLDFADSRFLISNLHKLQKFLLFFFLVSSFFVCKWFIEASQIDSSRGLTPAVKRAGEESRRPNIIFFASDGIDANFVSGYGNKNKTTPVLDKLLDDALFLENAFSNSERTTGSTTSMLTGKYPATTKVLFPPHVLTELDVYQHLPGVLKRLGYSTFQESVRYYADGNDLNFVQGFDLANGIESKQSAYQFLNQLPHANLFGNKIFERIMQRIKHLLWIENMPEVYRSVAIDDGFAKVYGLSDQSRIEKAVSYIQDTDTPFFMHLHLMDSHCCTFKPKNQHFSVGKFSGKPAKDKALIEDLLKESDDLLAEVIETLRRTKKLDDTIIVYSSDHSKGWDFRRRIPLAFIFPHGEYSRKIGGNTQLLDVAPTILDYLNVESPEWMEGQSLLTESPKPNRPIFVITRLKRGHFTTDKKDRLSHITGAGPPNYGLSRMAMIVCDTWYTYGLSDGDMTKGKVKNYSGICENSDIPSRKRAKKMIQKHLQVRGIAGQ
jgi:hypothetical protein